MSAELKATRRDATLILTLSNPGADNALLPDLCAAAIEVLSTAERDDAVRAVIITGADRTFCTGSNLNHLLEFRARDTGAQADFIDNLHSWIEAIHDCPKPVIAAVEGVAAGAGFSLALACDLIIAGSSASFSAPSINAGLTPKGGAAWFLAQALPRQLAAEVLFEGKPIAAAKLHQLGVINQVVADGSALDAALNRADGLATVSRHALERVKALLANVPGSTLDQHFEQEKQAFIESLFHADAHETIQAFLDKKKSPYQ